MPQNTSSQNPLCYICHILQTVQMSGGQSIQKFTLIFGNLPSESCISQQHRHQLSRSSVLPPMLLVRSMQILHQSMQMYLSLCMIIQNFVNDYYYFQFKNKIYLSIIVVFNEFLLTPTDYIFSIISSQLFLRPIASHFLSLSYSSLLSLLEREDRNRWFYLLKPVKKGTIVNGSGSQLSIRYLAIP